VAGDVDEELRYRAYQLALIATSYWFFGAIFDL
jgi:hypothetical protein